MSGEIKSLEKIELPSMIGQEIKGFVIKNVLGRGAFGNVFYAVKGGKDYAIKQICISDDNCRSAKMEEDIANRFRFCCPFILQLYDSFIGESLDGKYLFVVMEYCSNGDLEKLLKSFDPSKETNKLMRIVIQASLGLEHLHRMHLLHRDIKTENVFIVANGDIRIGDLGCGIELESTFELATTCVGTRSYMAPEVLWSSQGYSFSADVWSLGVLFYRLCTKSFPYDLNANPPKPSNVNWKYKPIAKSICPEVLCLIISKMLQVDPINRISVFDVLQMLEVGKWAKDLERYCPGSAPSFLPTPPKPLPPKVIEKAWPSDSPYGGRYRGTVKAGYPHGQGRWEQVRDGRHMFYEGEWVKGKYHGKGVFMLASGALYTGDL